MLPAAILLGGEMIAVSAARSISRSGVRIVALGDTTDPVRHSRFCHAFVDVGSKRGLLERYLAWFESGPGEGVILPCDDESVELVARHRERLLGWGYQPIEANDEVALAMLNKARTYELAARAGVPTPRTQRVSTHEDVARVAEAFEFPCALKPIQSHVFAMHFGIRRKLDVVQEPSELEEAFERASALGIDMLATELVPGAEDQFASYYAYIAADGQPLFHFTKRKLRQWPIRFGLGSYHLTSWDSEVAELGLRFFEGIGLRGVGNVEFKRDSRDGRWKLIECNHRFTAATEQVRLSGIDIPLLAYNRVVGRADPPVESYRTGLALWLPIEDTRAFLAYRREGELTTGAWLRSLARPLRFPMFRLSDPKPTLGSFAAKVRRRRQRRASAPLAPSSA